MWWDWNVEVYDSQSHVVALRREPSPKPGYTVERVKLCGRNVLLRIPPRSCAPLQDMGDVAIDLRRDRDLPAGQYFVTEQNRPLPQPGLSISVVESPRATDNRYRNESFVAALSAVIYGLVCIERFALDQTILPRTLLLRGSFRDKYDFSRSGRLERACVPISKHIADYHP